MRQVELVEENFMDRSVTDWSEPDTAATAVVGERRIASRAEPARTDLRRSWRLMMLPVSVEMMRTSVPVRPGWFKTTNTREGPRKRTARIAPGVGRAIHFGSSELWIGVMKSSFSVA